MTTTTANPPKGSAAAGRAADVQAREAGFFRDLGSVALRAVRQIPREPEAIIPALIVPVLGFVLGDLLQAVAAIAVLGAISFTLAFLSLRGRVKRG